MAKVKSDVPANVPDGSLCVLAVSKNANTKGAIVVSRVVGIYLFDDVEVLDFAGPFEVFSMASRVNSRVNSDNRNTFEVFTIAESNRAVSARGGLVVYPHFDITNHPPIDILIIPGGIVTAELQRNTVIDWIARTAHASTIAASVCSGAFLLGKAELLRGKSATTHWADLSDLSTMFPDIQVQAEARWVDTGQVVTSAGVSAGIDMCLHLVARLEGEELAIRTARHMEFFWQRPCQQ